MKKNEPTPIKLLKWLIEQTFLVAFAVTTVAIFRIGNMQLEGALPTAGIVLALLFALTSLLYNRARAHSNAEEVQVSLRAAEDSLQATLGVLLATIFASGTLVFAASSGTYPPLTPWRFPVYIIPTVIAFITSLILMWAFIAFHSALKTILFHLLDRFAARWTR